MERYWANTKQLPRPSPLNVGIGVTAHSEADARTLIAEHFGEIEIVGMMIVSDLGALDQKHVRPNMADHMVRGVWFPHQG